MMKALKIIELAMNISMLIPLWYYLWIFAKTFIGLSYLAVMRWDEMKKVFFSAYIYIKIWLADERSNCHEDESLTGKIETGTCKESFFSEIRTSLLKIKFTRK